jgi:hypothetical protein
MFLLMSACSSSSNGSIADAGIEDAPTADSGHGAVDGGPSEGGVDGGSCCPASPSPTGCILVGGYSTSGSCEPTICDNLCGYTLGTDSHGCPAWLYTPNKTCGDASFED